MSSPLLALFTRTLRDETRRRATYWARAGLGGFIALVMSMFTLPYIAMGAPGKSFFNTLVGLQMVAITFLGVGYFSSTIAGEKQQQTLGLLRMTALSPIAILLGKSGSRLCSGLLMLAAQFPFTVLAVTLGGVSIRQIFAVYSTLTAFTFLLCNLALLCSVLMRAPASAAFLCTLAAALLLGAGSLLEVLSSVWQRYHSAPSVAAALDHAAATIKVISPITRLGEVLGATFGGTPVGWQVASNLVLGVICFLLAWATFDRFCNYVTDEADGSRASSSPWWRFELRRSRIPRPWKDALLWKDFHFLCRGGEGFALRAFGYGVLLFPSVCLTLGILPNLSYAASALGSVAAFVFSLDVSFMAARMFRLELRDHTLSTLVMLPWSIPQIVRRKTLACLLAAAPGVLCVAAVQVIQLSFTSATGMGGPGGMPSMRTMMLLQVVSSWAHTILLVHIVAWLSLRMEHGALPLGFVISYAVFAFMSIASMAFLIPLGFTFRKYGAPFILFSPILSSVLSLVAAWILHYLGMLRLVELAGED